MSGGGEKTGASSDVKEKSDGGWGGMREALLRLWMSTGCWGVGALIVADVVALASGGATEPGRGMGMRDEFPVAKGILVRYAGREFGRRGVGSGPSSGETWVSRRAPRVIPLRGSTPASAKARAGSLDVVAAETGREVSRGSWDILNLSVGELDDVPGLENASVLV